MLFPAVVALQKNLPSYRRCALIRCAFLIALSVVTFSGSSCTEEEKNNIHFLSGLCWDFRYFSDLIKLHNFFLQQLPKKKSLLPALCTDGMCFFDLIQLYNLYGSFCTEKLHPVLPALCLDAMGFPNLTDLLNFFWHWFH